MTKPARVWQCSMSLGRHSGHEEASTERVQSRGGEGEGGERPGQLMKTGISATLAS